LHVRKIVGQFELRERNAMRELAWKVATLGITCFGAWLGPLAQDAPKPEYLDPSLPAERRAADLVQRMTLEEKASQLVNQARAVPRLNIPAYDWWSESLHGVMRDGTTEFPEPIGLAATFDVPAIHQMAIVIGTEGRIKHAQAVRAGHSDIFEGLDFWAPPGDLRRRSVSYRAHGRGLRYRHAGRRSALLSRHLHT
jgi:beta-glucosidase